MEKKSAIFDEDGTPATEKEEIVDDIDLLDTTSNKFDLKTRLRRAELERQIEDEKTLI